MSENQNKNQLPKDWKWVKVGEYVISVKGKKPKRVCNEKTTYNTLENCEGRMVSLHEGDIVVGVLGHRNALHGYSGVVPHDAATECKPSRS